VLNRMDDPTSPHYHPGFIERALFGALDVGRRGLEYLRGKSSKYSNLPIVQTLDSAISDVAKTTNDNIILPIFQKLGQMASQAFGIKSGLLMSAALDIRGIIHTSRLGGENEVFMRGGDFPVMINSNNELEYAANLASSLMKSIATGKMIIINNSNLSPSIVGSRLTSNDIKTALSTHKVQTNGSPKPLSTDADSILNPTNKKTYFGGKGFGTEGGSILEPYISNDGTPMLRNTADKFLRVGGESGERYDITTQQFTDIPSPTPESSKKFLDMASDKGLYELIKQTSGNENLTYDEYQSQINNDANLKSNISNVISAAKTAFDMPQAAKKVGWTTGFVNGNAIGSLIYAEVKKVFGGRPVTELDSKGGRGHVRRETHISINDLQPEQQRVFIQQLDAQGINYNKNWSSVKESVNLTEGWQSPKHTDIEPNERKRWFNPSDIAPPYPTKPPNTGVYTPSDDSIEANKREPHIKITKDDLLKNHRLKDSEVKEMMDTINALNAFLDAHPEELIHAQKRYPKNDVRLAELNWKMDQMLSASEEYMDTHFPENTRLFNRVQKSINRSIKLTDPKTYKDTKLPDTYRKLFSVDYVSSYGVEKKILKLGSKNKKSPARFLKKPRLKTKAQVLEDKLMQLETDLKKLLWGLDTPSKS